MPVSVVVGGQFGSEGKGKVAHFLASEMNAKVAVRVGGPNAGHTAVDLNGQMRILRQLPTASLIPNVVCALGAGSYINPHLLLEEMRSVGMSEDRLVIDPNALVITEAEEQQEKASPLRRSIGSTLSGTGAAVKRRIDRDEKVPLAWLDPRLRPFVRPVASFLRECLNSGSRIIVEGTQGFGLSNLHSPHYPFVTSRDTTAAAFISEVGLSPLDVDDVVMVLRSFPIRVGGNSGKLAHEIDWDTVTHESGGAQAIREYTSVTKTLRRVGRFDAEIVRLAIIVNRPNRIVLNHVDYVDATSEGQSLSVKMFDFLEVVEKEIGRSVDYVGLSPTLLVPRARVEAKLRLA